MRHIENPGIVWVAYLGIFRLIKGHLSILSYFQVYWDIKVH